MKAPLKRAKALLKRYLSNLKVLIATGIFLGWAIYGLTVFFAQRALNAAVREVTVFQKLFQNDPAITGVARYAFSANSDWLSNLKQIDFRPGDNPSYNIMAWRIAQNLEVLTVDEKPNQMSKYIDTSLGAMLKSTSTAKLQEMSGISMIFDIMAMTGKNGSTVQKEITLEFLESGLAGAPMAETDYNYYIEFNERNSSAFQKFLAYMFPPEISGSFWGNQNLNDLLGLAYKHIGVGEEFDRLDQSRGSLDQMTSYNQYNDLLLKLMIMVYNDSDVVWHRDLLLVFKGLVQCLTIMVFCIAMLLVLLHDITAHHKRRTLELLKTMLPTLGFIGTIQGLMMSLGNAYKIPIASGNANTSLAISEITASLSISFTTTLLAFVLLLLVDLTIVIKLRNLKNGFGSGE